MNSHSHILIVYTDCIWDNLTMAMIKGENTVTIQPNIVEKEIINHNWDYFTTQLCQGLIIKWEGFTIRATFVYNQRITNSYAFSRYYPLKYIVQKRTETLDNYSNKSDSCCVIQ